ncbi:MAG: hypothetical protein PHU41_06105 [Sulfuricurvum sp.]|nr:hypothetical protein [Sulfuricurvum sp.]
MRPFMYIIIFIFAFILLKAFYLDSLPSESHLETNSTVEEVSKKPESSETAKENPPPTGWADKSGRPIDQLGDSIAEKLKGKF